MTVDPSALRRVLARTASLVWQLAHGVRTGAAMLTFVVLSLPHRRPGSVADAELKDRVHA